jgi:ATP-dependent DNA helicase RecQ
VRYVYHYNLPKSLESYSQEIGRAGRDGAPSTVEMLACPADVPTLQNFAYGDTPTRTSLRALVAEILSAGQTFDVSISELATRHDIRQLVVRTVLTYLELLGVLRQGTPLYAVYEARPMDSLAAVLDALRGEPREFVDRLFGMARQGRVWFRIEPAAAALALGAERERVVRALHYLDDHGLIELRASDARLRFSRAAATASNSLDVDELLTTLAQRFEHREEQEIARLNHVLRLVETPDCQTAALVGYFGETLAAQCGHCGACTAPDVSRVLPSTPALEPIDIHVKHAALAALADAHPAALGEPRQQARFLCGLTSPALTTARLSRHTLFGVLDGYPFAAVLAWCSNNSAS